MRVSKSELVSSNPGGAPLRASVFLSAKAAKSAKGFWFLHRQRPARSRSCHPLPVLHLKSLGGPGAPWRPWRPSSNAAVQLMLSVPRTRNGGSSGRTGGVEPWQRRAELGSSRALLLAKRNEASPAAYPNPRGTASRRRPAASRFSGTTADPVALFRARARLRPDQQVRDPP